MQEATIKPVGELAFAFRGDTRSWAELEKAGGFIVQTDAPDRARALGLDQPWNPFADPTNREKNWFRNVSLDNDLYTTISLAPQLRYAGRFPLLTDMIRDHNATLRVGGKEPDDWNMTAGQETTSDAHLYLVCVTTGVDTKALQGKENTEGGGEVGSKSIDKGDILATMTVSRQWRVGEGDPHTVEVTDVKLLHQADSMKKRYGDEPADEISTQIFDLKGQKLTQTKAQPAPDAIDKHGLANESLLKDLRERAEKARIGTPEADGLRVTRTFGVAKLQNDQVLSASQLLEKEWGDAIRDATKASAEAIAWRTRLIAVGAGQLAGDDVVLLAGPATGSRLTLEDVYSRLEEMKTLKTDVQDHTIVPSGGATSTPSSSAVSSSPAPSPPPPPPGGTATNSTSTTSPAPPPPPPRRTAVKNPI